MEIYLFYRETVIDILRKNFNKSLKDSQNFTCLTVNTGPEKFKAVRDICHHLVHYPSLIGKKKWE